MKSFKSLQEERGEKAFKQAIAMGLKYSGFGYWKDPQTGETKFRTENDTLVPVEQEPEAELYKGGKPGEGPGGPDGMGGQGMPGMQGMMNPAGMLQMPGAGGQLPGQGILGAPNPGEEQAPKEKGWEPGPDGNTCVGPDSQEPGKVEKDSFVGRTNYLKWTAGPDGDNINTVSPAQVAESAPVDELKKKMMKDGKTDYDAIDEKMRKIAKEYDITPTEFHNDFKDENNGKTPDQWIKSKMSYESFLSEESPADMAKRMGLQSDGSGGYIDPNTGQVVARTVNNELIFYDPQGGAVSAQSGGAQVTQAQPSWKDPVTGEMTVPPGQPESPEEMSAVPDVVPAQAPPGYNAFMNAKKKDMYAQQAPLEQEAIDTLQQQVNPQLGMTEDVTDGQPAPNMPQQIQAPPIKNTIKKPESMISPGPRQRVGPVTPKPVVKDTDGDGDVDIDDLRNTARNSWQNWTTAKITADHRVEKKLQPAIDALNRPGVDPKMRNRIMHSLMNAYRYEGRDNEASSDLNKAEFHALRDNRKRILEGYGGAGSDGTKHDLAAIREYQKQINATEMDDGLIDLSFAALSPTQQKIFGGGDMTPRQGYGKYLRQGGLGGYTGLPLDYRTMQMEHFIDDTMARNLVSQAKQEGRDLTPEEQELIDFIKGEDNQFWARQSPNEQKSSRNPGQFFSERVDPLEALGDDFFDYRELTVDPARLDLKGKEKEMVGHLIQEDEEGNKFLSEMNSDQYSSHEDAVNQVYGQRKNDLLTGLGQAFDTKSVMGLGPKTFDNRVADSGSDITEDDRPIYEMLRNLQGKIKGYNPDFAYRVLQGLGLSTGLIQSERTRTTKASPAIYQAIASQLPGMDPATQKEFIKKVGDWWTAANSHANSKRGQGLKDADIRNANYSHLLRTGIDNGIFSDVVQSNHPDLVKLINKFLTQSESFEEAMSIDEDQNFDLEDILDVVKELTLIEKSKGKKRKGRGLKFDSFRGKMKE